MLAVAGGKVVLDKYLAVASQRASKGIIIGLLFRMEAEVFEHYYLAGLQGGHGSTSGLANTICYKGHGMAENFSQYRCYWRQTLALVAMVTNKDKEEGREDSLHANCC